MACGDSPPSPGGHLGRPGRRGSPGPGRSRPGGPGPGRSRRACSRGGRGRRGGRRAGPGRSGPPVRAAGRDERHGPSAARWSAAHIPCRHRQCSQNPARHPRCRQLARRRRSGPCRPRGRGASHRGPAGKARRPCGHLWQGDLAHALAGFPAQCPCCRGHGTTGRAAPALGAHWRDHRRLLRRRGPEKARTGRTCRRHLGRRLGLPDPVGPGGRCSQGSLGVPSGGRRLQRGHRDGVEGTYLTARRVRYYLSLVRAAAGNRPVIATVPRPTTYWLGNYPYGAEAPLSTLLRRGLLVMYRAGLGGRRSDVGAVAAAPGRPDRPGLRHGPHRRAAWPALWEDSGASSTSRTASAP